MNSLREILGILATSLGSLSVVITILALINESLKQKNKLKVLNSKEFETILDTSDIKILGKYLDNEIGQMTISDYVDNESINQKIQTFINKLTRFVGTEEQIDKEKSEQIEIDKDLDFDQQKLKDFPFKGKLGEEFDKILSELFYGEAWNALARLRRFIEIKLRDLCLQNNIPVEKMYSISHMIELLKRHEVIELDVARNLKYPVHVSNKAIHGQDLKKGEAEEAIFNAAKALNKIFNQ